MATEQGAPFIESRPLFTALSGLLFLALAFDYFFYGQPLGLSYPVHILPALAALFSPRWSFCGPADVVESRVPNS